MSQEIRDETLAAPIPNVWFDEVRRRAGEELQSHCIENTDPEKAARILWMLAQGVSKLRISREVGVRRETITRLSWTHKDTLETKRKEFSTEFAKAAELYKDLLIEKGERLAENPALLDAISPDKLAVTIGVMTDKAAMLNGMPNVIIEQRKGVSLTEAAEYLKQVRERVARKASGKVIDAEPVTQEISD